MRVVRTVLLKLHLWIGLGGGLLIAFIAITGAMLVWTDEIDRSLNPSMMTVRPQEAPRLTSGQLIDAFEKANPGQRVASFFVPPSPSIAPYGIVRVDRVFMDPYTARVLGRRDVRVGFMVKVHQLHTKLLAGKVGEQIVGYTAVALLFISISGIWLWWKRRILSTRRTASWWRINFDLHNFTGIYSAVFLIVMCLSGMLMSFSTLGSLVYKVAGEPPDTDEPEVEWQKGVPRISWDRALDAADKALPGARTTFIQGANPRKGYFQVSKRFPEDGTPGGRSRVCVQGQTGEVLQVINSRLVHPSTKVFNWNRPIHTGDVGGMPTRILWFISCVLVLAQAITGFLIWWKRYRAKKITPARREAAALVEDDVPA